MNTRDASLAAIAQRERMLTVALPVAFTAMLLIGWQLAARGLSIPPSMLPAPSDVIASFSSMHLELLRHALATGSEAMLAFAMSVVLGVVIALVLKSSNAVFEAFYPHVVIIQIIPKIALAPLFVIWLGYDTPSRLTYSVFISFFPVALAVMTGLGRADSNALRLAQSLTASRWQTLLQVQIPYALPYFVSGLKVSATMSVIGIVVGEFISSKQGLGHFILVSQSRSQTANIFAALIVLCVVGLIPYAIAIASERALRRWWRE